MNLTDEDIRGALERVPALPDTVFDGVVRRVRARSRITRVVWAVAATVALMVGTGVYTARIVPHDESHVSDEIVAELEWVGTFLSGADIDTEIDSYTLVSMEGF